MINKVVSLSVDKLHPHPDSPNKMSRGKFLKLTRNIEQSGLYEPLIVRKRSNNEGYEIINGHQRLEALRKLGYRTAECIVWDIDDYRTRLLLCTLNRLSGRDKLQQKKKIIRELIERLDKKELGKFVPYNKKQLERLCKDADLNKVKSPAESEGRSLQPVVFFLDEKGRRKLDKALKAAAGTKKISNGKEKSEAIVKLAEKSGKGGSNG